VTASGIGAHRFEKKNLAQLIWHVIPRTMEADDQLGARGASPISFAEESHSSHIGARLRGYFVTGLIIVGPVAMTIHVVLWFIKLVDAWVKPLLPKGELQRNTA
jgi:hypothetical protein